ncbi:hypothetical protein K439DRAFT_1640392 [Ramaria rubella]|nr:hypothetical protein K439DRAFT_1640392 [Ramaria rubella]
MASNTTSTSSTYKVDAKNEAHREGFLNATSAAERSAYVLANYEIKEPSASVNIFRR